MVSVKAKSLLCSDTGTTLDFVETVKTKLALKEHEVKLNELIEISQSELGTNVIVCKSIKYFNTRAAYYITKDTLESLYLLDGDFMFSILT